MRRLRHHRLTELCRVHTVLRELQPLPTVMTGACHTCRGDGAVLAGEFEVKPRESIV